MRRSRSFGSRVSVTEPVLVMGFNRPELLGVLLDRLREIRPTTIYVAIDGPRPDRDDDAARVAACRALAEKIDWTSDVHTLFREENLGCGRGVTANLDWFFSEVERGIILEDDVIPEPGFFPFCTDLLDRYQDDARVFSITGCNVVPRAHLARPGDPYRFSQIPLVWGWATWRRSWQLHRFDDRGWFRELGPVNLWRRSGHSLTGALFWASNFELTARGDVDTWDWQLVCAAMRSGQMVATSNVNLVSNIGFGVQATHTLTDTSALQPVGDIELPLREAPVTVDEQADRWMRRHHFHDRLLTTVDRVRKYAFHRDPA